jgi:hypothetical protein
MKWKQLSVFLENKPGALSEPCRLLARAGVNIQTFSLADTREFGILRLVVDDSDKARRLLQRNGFAVKITSVVVVEVPDKPGGLAGILDALDGSGISVKYAYGFTMEKEKKGVLLFAFDDPEGAIEILKRKGISFLQNGKARGRSEEPAA